MKLTRVQKQTMDNLVENYLQPQTCILYHLDREKFMPFGSGVLVQKSGNHYLVSAAHVLDHIDKLFINCNGFLRQLEYSFHISTSLKPDQDREDDKLDISIVLLESSFAQALSISNHYFDLNNPRKKNDNAQLVAAGYPLTKVKTFKSQAKANLIVFFTEENNDFKNSRFAKSYPYHTFVNYSKKALSNGQLGFTPNSKGMSGSGLWMLASDNGKVQLELAGIIIERVKEPTSLLIVANTIIVEDQINVIENKLLTSSKKT